MKNNVLIILLLIAGLFSGFLMGYKYIDDKLEISHQNLIAATDSLNIIKGDNEKLLYEKSVYILKEKELSSALDISKKDIDKLKKRLGSALAYISNVKGQFRTDTIEIEKLVPIPMGDNKKFEFKYNDDWFSISGDFVMDPYWNMKNFHLYDINAPVTLKVGLTEDNKMYVESDNPYMKITDIEGAYVIENLTKSRRKPKLSHGMHVGFGFQYGIGTHSFDFGPYFGYGITYNF